MEKFSNDSDSDQGLDPERQEVGTEKLEEENKPEQFPSPEEIAKAESMMTEEEKEQMPSKEKPPFFYHGSPHKNIKEFESRVSKGTGEEFGAMVYATPDLALASAFLAEVTKEWSVKNFGDAFYVLIPLSREEFIKNDKGGYIYVLPSDTFESDPKRGLGEYEWASREKIKPSQKIEYSSALNAMIENGVQVYFVDDNTYEQIKESKDHGFSILKNLESENQRRGINVKPLGRIENSAIPE